MLARLYTEDKNREVIEELATKWLNSFTLYTAQGRWEGIAEQSVIIEVGYPQAEDDEYRAVLGHLAEEIKYVNQQEAILIVYIPSETQVLYNEPV